MFGGPELSTPQPEPLIHKPSPKPSPLTPNLKRGARRSRESRPSWPCRSSWAPSTRAPPSAAAPPPPRPAARCHPARRTSHAGPSSRKHLLRARPRAATRAGAAPAGPGPTARPGCGQGRFVKEGWKWPPRRSTEARAPGPAVPDFCPPDVRGLAVGPTPMLAARACAVPHVGLEAGAAPWRYCDGFEEKKEGSREEALAQAGRLGRPAKRLVTTKKGGEWKKKIKGPTLWLRCLKLT